MTVMGNPGPRSQKAAERRIDDLISQAWARYASGIQVPIMDIPRIFRDIKLEMAGGMNLEDSVRAAADRYRVNMNPAPNYRPNPFVLVDSETLKIIRNWKGSMMDRKPWEWAQEAARRLDRDVYVVAHPYVPAGFKAGVEVSPLFFAGGPFQVVSSDGSSRQGDLTDIRQSNPGFGASVVGSLVGGMMANALSNPGRSLSQPDEHAAQELELYVSNDSQLYHSQFIPIVKNLMKRRAAGTYNHEKAAKLFLYLADAGARKYYKEFGTQRGGFKFDLATRWAVAKSLRDSFETEAELGNYDKMAFGVSNNPRRRARRAAPKRNPGPRHLRGKRKVTMPIERFARIVKAQKDPALWRDFVAKCKGYHKWSHGTWPTKVTVEAIKKPGMQGIWIAYGMGKEPEKTYIMPKGTKRKGAWKHPWEKMPSLMGDPEAGFILTKLVKGNKMTDFLHGN
jgi:hypothetical protein